MTKKKWIKIFPAYFQSLGLFRLFPRMTKDIRATDVACVIYNNLI